MRWISLCFMVIVLTGCESFRAHDAGRSTGATKASDTAKTLATEGGGIFEPMRKNLEATWKAQDATRELLVAHRRETFLATFTNWTAEKTGKSLVQALSDRLKALELVTGSKATAAENVNAQMVRQKAISTVLKSNEPQCNAGGKCGLDLDATLGRVETRLKWLDGKLDKALKLTTKASNLEGVGSASETVGEFIKKANAAIKEVKNDENAAAARALLKDAVAEATAFETERLEELRLHLKTIDGIAKRTVVRDQIITCTILVPGLFQVYPSVTTSTQASILKQLEKSPYDCANSDDFKADAENTSENEEIIAAWSGEDTRLASFVAASLKANAQGKPKNRAGAEMAAGLGILLFHEQAFIEKLELDAAREIHLHSIRLSEINARQRAGLVHQLTQSLDIYFKGGVRPEAVAELLVLLGQVGALSFIGAQQ